MPRKLDPKKVDSIKELAEAAKKEGKIVVSAIADAVKASTAATKKALIGMGFDVGRGSTSKKVKATAKGGGEIVPFPFILKGCPVPKDYEGLKEAKKALEAKLETVNAALAVKAKEIQADLKSLGIK